MSKGCLKGCLKGVLKVPKGCVEGVWTVSGGVCLDSGLEGVWRGVYLEVGRGVSKGGVSGKMVCMEGCVWRGML